MPRGTTQGVAEPFPFLQLASSLGRTGAAFLIASNFAFLIAPMFYLLDLGPLMDEANRPAMSVLLFLDPSRIFSIGDVLLLIGAAILAGAIALVLIGLRRAGRHVPIDAFVLGAASLGVSIGWFAASLGAQGGSRGGDDIVAAVGGWSVAALLLLVGSALYVAFAFRVDRRAYRRGLAPVRWPVFAALSLAGTTVFLVPGIRDEVLATAALAMAIIFLPLLGVVAYRDVMESFEIWPREARVAAAGRTVAVPVRFYAQEVARIDRAASLLGASSRSAFLRDAVLEKVAATEEGPVTEPPPPKDEPVEGGAE